MSATTEQDVLAEPLLSTKEMAEHLGVSVYTVRRWRTAGLLPSGIWLGREWRFSRADVRKVLAQAMTTSAEVR